MDVQALADRVHLAADSPEVSPEASQYVMVLIDDFDAMVEVIQRLQLLVHDLSASDPYGVDLRDYWCVHCCEHAARPEEVQHRTDCVWLRARLGQGWQP